MKMDSNEIEEEKYREVARHDWERHIYEECDKEDELCGEMRDCGDK